MSLKLAGVHFVPRGADGWTTPPLIFGDVFTLVLGPNGAGKTPLLKGVVYAFGHLTELPPEIMKRCESVEVALTSPHGEIRLQRKLTESFECIVTSEDGAQHRVVDQKLFAKWLIDKLDIPYRELSSRAAEPVPPYMSVLTPVFWVDQDLGWKNRLLPSSQGQLHRRPGRGGHSLDSRAGPATSSRRQECICQCEATIGVVAGTDRDQATDGAGVAERRGC